MNMHVHARIIAIIIILTLLVIAICIHMHAGVYKSTPPRSAEVVADLPGIRALQRRMDSHIEENLRKEVGKRLRLHEMCMHAVSGGKKIRSVILLSISDKSVKAALAIEYLHAASLVLDDIMDKDDYRRGQPSLHKKYGLGHAQMCALLLIATAGKLMRDAARSCELAPGTMRNDLTVFIYDNLFNNLRDLIEGQYMDVSNGDANPASAVELIHKKTGTMFEIPFVMGWTMKNGRVPDDETLHMIQNASKYFGQMFQVADDFEDAEQDEKAGARFNYVLNYGRDAAHVYFSECMDKFNSASSGAGICTPEIREAVAHLSQKVRKY